MRVSKLIGIRQLWAGTRKTLVLLTRNEGGSVAGQCLLDEAERPIVDGPTPRWVLAVIEDALEVLLLARRVRMTKSNSQEISMKARWELL